MGADSVDKELEVESGALVSLRVSLVSLKVSESDVGLADHALEEAAVWLTGVCETELQVSVTGAEDAELGVSEACVTELHVSNPWDEDAGLGVSDTCVEVIESNVLVLGS